MRDIREVVNALKTSEKTLETLRAEYEVQITALNQKYQPRIESLDQECKAFRLVAEKLGLLNETEGDTFSESDSTTVTPESKTDSSEISKSNGNGHHFQRYEITIKDATEKVLREAGRPMGIDELLEKVAELGVTPGRPSFRSAVAKNKKLFERVSDGVYKLRDSNGDSRNDVQPQNTKTLETERENNQINLFSLTDAVKDLVPEFENRQFTVQDLLDELIRRYPDNVSQDRRNSISALLSIMFSKNEIERVQEGKGGAPAIYRTKQTALQKFELPFTQEVPSETEKDSVAALP